MLYDFIHLVFLWLVGNLVSVCVHGQLLLQLRELKQKKNNSPHDSASTLDCKISRDKLSKLMGYDLLDNCLIKQNHLIILVYNLLSLNCWNITVYDVISILSWMT